MSVRSVFVWISLIVSSLQRPTELHGQTVHFSNSSLAGFVTDGEVIVRAAGGSPLVGTNFVAQLYYGTSPTDLVADTRAPARFRVPTTSAPGTWVGSDRTLSGLSVGSLAVLAVRVWDMSQAPTYEQALAWGTPAHDCGPFYYEVKPDGLSSPTNYFMFEFRARNGLDACPSNQLPVFQSQPQNQTVYRGDTLTLSADVVAGCLYQWRFNGQIVGYRPTLVISNAQASHSGSYQLIAGNFSGSVTSQTASVGVSEPALVHFGNSVPFQTPGERIVRWPDGSGITGTNYVVQLYYGPSVSNLQPLPDSPLPLRPHSAAVPGTWSGADRRLPGVTPGAQVMLEVRMWDSRAGATFEAAQSAGGLAARFFPFNYTPPAGPAPGAASFYMENFRSYLWLSCPMFPTPVIHVHPASQSARRGTNVTLRVIAEYPCHTEWFFNGTPITSTYPGSSTLTISNIQPANVGDYYARVVNFDGSASATSQVARVTLIGQPRLASITQSGGRFVVDVPANSGEQIVIETATNLSATATWTPVGTNTGPFSYTNSAATDRQRFYRTRTSPWF